MQSFVVSSGEGVLSLTPFSKGSATQRWENQSKLTGSVRRRMNFEFKAVHPRLLSFCRRPVRSGRNILIC